MHSLARSPILALTASILLIAPLVSAQSPAPGHLVAHISGLRNDRGSVGCVLFDDADAFPTNPNRAVAHMFVHSQNGQALCDFVPPHAGTYAIAAFHDENGNGRMDRNFIGIPSEGTGCSNGARGHFGPPHFADARFVFDGTTLSLPIRIAY